MHHVRTQAQEEDRLRRWVEDQVANCTPRQDLEDALTRAAWDRDSASEESSFAVACFVVAGEVMRVMEIRHEEGERLEREGMTDDAIRLYKQNVGDRYLRPDSYRRLARIYRDRGDREAESRIRALLKASRKRDRAPARSWIN